MEIIEEMKSASEIVENEMLEMMEKRNTKIIPEIEGKSRNIEISNISYKPSQSSEPIMMERIESHDYKPNKLISHDEIKTIFIKETMKFS